MASLVTGFSQLAFSEDSIFKKPIQLSEAVLRANEWHPHIKESRAKLIQQGYAIDVAEAGYYPQINGGLRGGYEGSGNEGGVSQSLLLSASQMLYDFGKVSSAVEAEQAILSQQQAELLLTIDEIAQKTASAVIEVWRFQELENKAQEQVLSLEEVMNLVEEYQLPIIQNVPIVTMRMESIDGVTKNQNLKDGSWIVSYKVDNDQVWNDIKNGKHVGFSIEGWFDKENIKLKTKNTKMSKETKTLFERVFGAKNKFSEAESVDGVVLVWEGELAEGTELKVKTEEGEVLAPEGTHSITDEEGAITVITVDGNGIIVSVESGEVAEVEEEMTAEKIAEVISELRKEFKAEIKKVSDKNIELEKENQTFKTQIETLTTELDKDEKKKFVTEKGKNWKTLKK